MNLTKAERQIMTEVAQKFYADLSFQTITNKSWEELDEEERETFIQGQKWLYGYYSLAFRKGYEKGVDASKTKLNELISNHCVFIEGG